MEERTERTCEEEATQIKENTRLCRRLAIGASDEALISLPDNASPNAVARISLEEHPDPDLRSMRSLELLRDGTVRVLAASSGEPSWLRETLEGDEDAEPVMVRVLCMVGPVVAELLPTTDGLGELLWDSAFPSKAGGFSSSELDTKREHCEAILVCQIAGTGHIHELFPHHTFVSREKNDENDEAIGWIIVSEDEGDTFTGICFGQSLSNKKREDHLDGRPHCGDIGKSFSL